MGTQVPAKNDVAPKMTRQQMVRYAGAVLAAATALMYFLIGFNVVKVIEPLPGDEFVQTYFGIPAGLAYALGALLLLFFRRRFLWILGALLQLFVIFVYFNLASQREPAYELWGILIRVTQVLLLGALLFLVVKPERAPQPKSAQVA